MTTASAVPDNFIILPSLDLKEGQSLDAALSNLTLLEAQFSKICSQLDQRLSNLKGKLGGINERIGISRQKVETLRDINEAITIVSPSKFVRVYKKGQDATHHSAINTEYVNNKKIPPFNYENNMNLNTNIKPTPTPGPGSSSQGGLLQKTTPGAPPTANGHHHEDELRKVVKLARGMFNTKRELFSGSANIQHQRFEGLGRIPRDVKYVDSLVVFNSRHNPYQKYLQIDNTTSNTNINVPRKKGQKETKINIQEAPRTLVEGEILTQFTTEEHRFKPEAKALPQLVAPTQLGLKGIVNINLGNYEVEGITPSKGGTVNRPTVPDPKFNETTQSNLLDPSMLSVQRFSNVGPNNETAASPTMQSSYSNPPQNQSQQSSGGYGGFAPTLSQSKQINVQAPTVSVSQPQINMTTSTYVQPQQQRPNNVTQPQNAAPMNPTPQPTNNQAVPANNAAPAQPATNNAAPAAAPKKAGGSRAALLDEIRNPKIKLKKADPDAEEKKAPLERKGGSKPAPAMNHLDHLKQQIQLRFQALNKNKKKEESSEDEEDD